MPSKTWVRGVVVMVRELVEAQGGKCWIEEASGQGARVVVRLSTGAALP